MRSHPGVDSTLRRPGRAEAITVKIRVIRTREASSANCGARDRKPTMYDGCPPRRCARPVEARLG
jgi:hypothetical protein